MLLRESQARSGCHRIEVPDATGGREEKRPRQVGGGAKSQAATRRFETVLLPDATARSECHRHEVPDPTERRARHHGENGWGPNEPDGENRVGLSSNRTVCCVVLLLQVGCVAIEIADRKRLGTVHDIKDKGCAKEGTGAPSPSRTEPVRRGYLDGHRHSRGLPSPCKSPIARMRTHPRGKVAAAPRCRCRLPSSIETLLWFHRHGQVGLPSREIPTSMKIGADRGDVVARPKLPSHREEDREVSVIIDAALILPRQVALAMPLTSPTPNWRGFVPTAKGASAKAPVPRQEE